MSSDAASAHHHRAIKSTVIRPARHDEVRDLQAVELDAARTYGLVAETAFCLELSCRSDEEHARVRAAGITLVAELDGGLIGFILGLPIDGRAHILELAVARSHQAQGHGRQLLLAIENWSRASGYAEATLTTFRDIPWNGPSYAKAGYRAFEVGADRPGLAALIEEERTAGFHRAPRIAMRKQLTEAARTV